jgi:hypothetical protein
VSSEQTRLAHGSLLTLMPDEITARCAATK